MQACHSLILALLTFQLTELRLAIKRILKEAFGRQQETGELTTEMSKINSSKKHTGVNMNNLSGRNKDKCTSYCTGCQKKNFEEKRLGMKVGTQEDINKLSTRTNSNIALYERKNENLVK